MCSNFLEGSDNFLSRDIGRHPKIEKFFVAFFNLKIPFWVQIHPKSIQNRKLPKTIQITFNAKKGLCVNQSHSLVGTEALKISSITISPGTPHGVFKSLELSDSQYSAFSSSSWSNQHVDYDKESVMHYLWYELLTCNSSQ